MRIDPDRAQQAMPDLFRNPQSGLGGLDFEGALSSARVRARGFSEPGLFGAAKAPDARATAEPADSAPQERAPKPAPTAPTAQRSTGSVQDVTRLRIESAVRDLVAAARLTTAAGKVPNHQGQGQTTSWPQRLTAPANASSQGLVFHPHQLARAPRPPARVACMIENGSLRVLVAAEDLESDDYSSLRREIEQLALEFGLELGELSLNGAIIEHALQGPGRV